MKITVDASCLLINRYSGLSEVVHNLLLQLPLVDTNNQYALFMNYFRSTNAENEIYYPGTINLFCKVPRRIMAWWWKFNWPPIDFYLTEADLFHSFHIQIPPTRKIKTVLTVHDCRYLAMPTDYKYQEVENYRQQMNTSLERAEMVVTVSEFTRQEVLNHFAYPEDRIRVIYNGLAPFPSDDAYSQERVARFTEKKNIPQFYLLYTGVLDPRKNLERLIEAIARCKEETQSFPDLVIAGVSYEKWLRSRQAIWAKELGIFNNIHICGVVTKGILTELTRRAHALCYPSLYEGFGFPPLEAMALGVPVLASNCSAIPEVTGHAACLADPTSVDEIVLGLNRIVFDSEYRQNLIESGYQQIKKFSWREAAAKYINIYKEVLSS